MIFRKIVPAITAGALLLANISFTAVPAGAVLPTDAVSAEIASAAAAGDSIDRANQQQIVDVFNGINEYRASLGVAPLTFNATISEMAEDWSDEMAANGFRHNPNFHTDARVGNGWMAAAENIAANHHDTGESLVWQWEASEPHAKAMADPAFTVIGVGITQSVTAEMRLYGTVNLFSFIEGKEPAGAFTTAQDFFDGRPSIDLIAVTPVAPTLSNTTSEYVIPAKQAGVEYFVGDVLQTPGTHHTGWNYVTITAKATAGYALRGTTTWWLEPQPRRITAEPPAFDDAAGTYTIPHQEGVNYLIQEGTNHSSRNIAPGTYPGADLVMIYVTAADGFILENPWAAWNHNFPAPAEPPVSPTPPAPAPSFSDAHRSAFQSSIGWMKDRGISRGYEDGTYRPFESVSREAMAAFVYRLAGQPDYMAPEVSGFKDVATTHLFYKEISWMKASGLSTGWSDGTYRPSDLVSREAMAAFMKRYAGAFCGLAGAAEFAAPAFATFVDSPDSAFYKEIEWMRVAEVSTGWEDGTYRPFEHVTREAMAAFMQRLDTHITAGGGCAP